MHPEPITNLLGTDWRKVPKSEFDVGKSWGAYRNRGVNRRERLWCYEVVGLGLTRGIVMGGLGEVVGRSEDWFGVIECLPCLAQISD